MNPDEIEREIATLKQNNDAILSLLRKVLNPEGKININMTIEELVVYITGKSNSTIEISTATTDGKIMLCALKDFKDNMVFGFSAMSKSLDDRGWHTPNGTLAPTLSRMVSKGLLIKENSGYRLPSKVTYSGETLAEAT